MEKSSRDPNHISPPTHRRNPPSFSSSRSTLTKFHSHSRSIDSQHNHSASSSTSLPSSSTSATVRSNKTSRIMSSVRRSLSVSHSAQKKTLPFDMADTGMYSTCAERAVQHSTRFRRQDSSSSPPSIEQIAMGLHLSRTPHLRSSSVPSHPYSQRPAAAPLPPPPSRSALKKPGKTSSSAPSLDPPSASSTATSSFPPTPQSNCSLLSVKSRMSRFLSGLQTSSAPCSVVPSPAASPRGSTSDFVPPKKAVRFSSSVLSLNHRKEED